MDRAPIDVFNSTTKACADCAHFTPDTRCARAPKVDEITGAASLWSCMAERTSYLSCGTNAIHFLPSNAAEAARSVRKIQLSRAIEQSLDQLRPDLNQAVEILDALQAALEARFPGERLTDVVSAFKEYREALNEADEVPA